VSVGVGEACRDADPIAQDEPGHRGPFHRPARERLRQVEGVIASGIEDEDEGDDVKRRDPQERAACDGTLERRGHRLRG